MATWLGATLGGPTSATASQGVAIFSGLTLTAAAPGYTLQVSRDGLAAATTAAITITPAVPAELVPAGVPAGLTAGSAIGLSIDVVDADGNRAPSPAACRLRSPEGRPAPS